MKMFLRIIAVVSWLITIAWLLFEPGFEPLIAFLGGTGAFVASLYVKESHSSGIVIGRTNKQSFEDGDIRSEATSFSGLGGGSASGDKSTVIIGGAITASASNEPESNE